LGFFLFQQETDLKHYMISSSQMQSYDAMLSILQNIDTIQHLGILACTSKILNTHISNNTKLWIHAGEKLCGSEHWRPIDQYIPFNSTYPRLKENDQRYIVKSRVCPWMTEPKQSECGVLNSINALGGTFNFKSIKVLSNICKITLTLRGGNATGFLRDGPPSQVVVRTDAYGTTTRLDTVKRVQQHWQMPSLSEDEITLLEDLKRTQWRPSELYQYAISTVRIVHSGLFCVFAPEVESGFVENTIMYFVSTKTRLVLHTHR
jgi:hypothetical protein